MVCHPTVLQDNNVLKTTEGLQTAEEEKVCSWEGGWVDGWMGGKAVLRTA